ncbi:hypothetical protein HC251_13000 [Iamia sp. SCSIO 61187]|uniref:DUF6361 family protein n=1 Tax=Iamia sp. SCSIO 61187 TaxID=2722752 RepID=UPI001C62CE19|nr:DUF6361 family protein [Iamia sp. SCSIO 61187]QYG93252.1 hypothetical protein HC251_13000 [Iamia sp. SCSIO 61187]
MSDDEGDVASFFGWLDYDDREAQRMREVFAAFDDKDTIDSLGLGVIRDSISDQLFPGVSTIQTRARYFLFVPWICQMLEAERVPMGRFNDRLRELEVALIESLRGEEGANQGVIGYRARRRLTRLPSTVYWNGLQVFGIRLLDLASSEYRGFVARGTPRTDIATDDDGEPLAATRHMWDPALPKAPKRFPAEPISMALTSEESDYLAGRMTTSRPESMVGELARDLSIDRSAAMPWEVPIPHAPPRLEEVLVHARNFSELMEGAQALHNLLLARRAAEQLGQDQEDLVGTLAEELEDWAELIDARRDELSSWITGEDFWYVIERQSRVPTPTRRFVLAWADLALHDPSVVSDSPEAALLVTEREHRLKGKLARLTEARALENWNGEPFSPGQMTFRWGNARRILDDLAHHEDA